MEKKNVGRRGGPILKSGDTQTVEIYCAGGRNAIASAILLAMYRYIDVGWDEIEPPKIHQCSRSTRRSTQEPKHLIRIMQLRWMQFRC